MSEIEGIRMHDGWGVMDPGFVARIADALKAGDIVDVIQQEAAEQLLHLGGVGAEETLATTVIEITRSRFAWLFVKLLTAVLASWVISFFDATIE